ncbi:MAG TPA: hypothetical protein VK691_04665 [Solirubrobacteraceae bacterium]|nr:hypothetical protein [Solirubrobacteraceae bacterium]
MASNTKGPRGRSRKPRPSAPVAGGGSKSVSDEQSTSPAGQTALRAGRAKSSRRRRAPSAARPPVSPQRTFGERPQAPWHPLPLSELLILAGGVAFVVAVTRLRNGPAAGGPLLLAGIAAVALGTIEVTWREHSSGYRSHTLLLALLPVIVLHSVVVLGYTFLAKASQLLNVGMFAVDIAVFVLLFRLLRTRFLDARARAMIRN